MGRKGFRAQVIGRQAEDAALAYLLARGLTPITRNFRAAYGEIDLVMRDGDNVVFVEVRYRDGGRFGDGAESVTRGKQRRIARCAARFLQQYPALAQLPGRFDVVSMKKRDQGFEVDWIRNAFLT